MKYIAIVLTLALSQVTASTPSLRQVDHKDTIDRELVDVKHEVVIEGHQVACLSFKCKECTLPFVFRLENEGCDCEIDKEQFQKILDKIKQELSDNSCGMRPRHFLKKIFGLLSTATDDQIIEHLEKLCKQAHEDQLNNATPFGEITHEGNLFDKEYYDGGTYYNEERETEEFPGSSGAPAYQLDDDPGTTINDFYNNEAQTWNVEYPSYMTNFKECKYNTAMCCFVQDRQADDNNGNCNTPYDTDCLDADPADNTDICYVDMEESQRSNHVQDGFAIYANDDDKGEGAAHCHGFAWADDKIHPSSMYRGNNLFYISMYDHLYQRGYVRNVPGAPMCSCLEQAAVVSRSDCTEIECVTEKLKFVYENGELSMKVVSVDIDFNSCQGVNNNNNDLYAYYQRLVDEGLVQDQEAFVKRRLVGKDQCPRAISLFLQNQIDSLDLLG